MVGGAEQQGWMGQGFAATAMGAPSPLGPRGARERARAREKCASKREENGEGRGQGLGSGSPKQ